MKDSLMAILRNKKSSIAEFRETAEKISNLLAAEVSQYLPKQPMHIDTPLAGMETTIVDSQDVVIVPILRSGLAMLSSFLRYYSQANVGFLGFKRDEKTFEPHFYYANMPKITPDTTILIIDPMLATAGTLSAAIDFFKKEHDVTEDNIVYAGILASQEGVRTLNRDFPQVKHVIAHVDEKLDQNKYIVPGLGDFGDRFFGTV